MYRPQYAMPQAPTGWVYQPCVYQFDRTNTPAFASVVLATGAQTGDIPLHLDKDACFILLAVKVIADGFNLEIRDPWTNPLMDDFMNGDLWANRLPPCTALEGPGLEVPAGAVFTVRLQGQ
jgi:hypothetical protein